MNGSLSSQQVFVLRKSAETVAELSDTIAVEEPLEIHVQYSSATGMMRKNISVTMRTPGLDEALAAGFLFTEQIIAGADDIKNFYSKTENSITVVLNEGVVPRIQNIERNFYSTSSCGICGKASIDSIRTEVPFYKKRSTFNITSKVLFRLPALLREEQQLFATTGGIHACALFTGDGACLSCMEDVGRHNALDKLIGKALLNRELPLTDVILLLSGRASFELVQKAVMAGIQVIAAVGAPSSLAVDTAKEFKCTLIGFLKNDRMNVYSGGERITDLKINHEASNKR